MNQKSGEELKLLRCLEDKPDDPVVAAIKRDLKGKDSILDLMKSYIDDLEGELDNNAEPFAKLAKLFELGATPERIEGHLYGATLGLKTGDAKGFLAEYSNALGALWSTTLAKSSPWVGKTFTPINREEVIRLTKRFDAGELRAHRGINTFNEMETSPLNNLSLIALTFWLRLKDAPKEERARFGYEKIGGHFLAWRARSVYPATAREVLQLNYRWPELDNHPPLSYLIDEIVEITDGLYVGQLLFATKRLFDKYDHTLAPSACGYQHFGYFLLMDESWRTEASRVFPHIDIPRAGPREPSKMPAKFTAFTFAEPPPKACKDEVMADIKRDMEVRETILDLLHFYSIELMNKPVSDSPYFERLNELFNRGLTPRKVKGFYRGALVTCNSEGFVGTLGMNTLNMAWNLARLFTPWTGKTFEDIDPDRLRELTDGHETGVHPTFWGANTYSQRTTRKRLAARAMKAAGIWTEEPTAAEKRMGIGLKSFFFIGREDVSVSAESAGKRVFRINYRWPKLKTFPPDNFCYDELVQITEGLYLGQLIYATEVFKKYDPDEPASKYGYQNFGYFLLMDEEWHHHRMKIGFDLDNT